MIEGFQIALSLGDRLQAVYFQRLYATMMYDLFWDAAEQCILSGGGSTSMLQRRFSIGYARAGRLMDQLYKAGVVGPERGSKPREILMSQEEMGNIRRTRGV